MRRPGPGLRPPWAPITGCRKLDPDRRPAGCGGAARSCVSRIWRSTPPGRGPWGTAADTSFPGRPSPPASNLRCALSEAWPPCCLRARVISTVMWTARSFPAKSKTSGLSGLESPAVYRPCSAPSEGDLPSTLLSSHLMCMKRFCSFVKYAFHTLCSFWELARYSALAKKLLGLDLKR